MASKIFRIQRLIVLIITFSAALFCSAQQWLVTSAQGRKLNIVIENNKYGVKDFYTDEIVVPITFDNLERFTEDLARARQNGKYGFIDVTGRFVVPAQFDMAWGFTEGLAAVQLNDKWGYIDKTGKVIIPMQFDDADQFSEGLARVKVNGKYGYIDKTGKFVIPAQLDLSFSFHGGLARSNLRWDWGFINKVGMFVIPAQFNDVHDFSEGLSCVRKGSDCGYIDKTGKFVIPLQFASAWDFSDGLAKVKDKVNGKYGFIDKTGKIVIPAQYSEVESFSEGLARVKMNGRWGFIDRTGKLVIPAQFDNAWDFSEGLAKVKLNGQHKFVDSRGKFYELAESKATIKKLKDAESSWDNYLAFRLGSIDKYLAKRGIVAPDQASVKAAVEKKIVAWQKKDEFETTKAWQERVNEQSRDAKAAEFANAIVGDYQTAVADYNRQVENLVGEYAAIESRKFKKQPMTLHQYDSDNETYLITIQNYGDLLLPVPLSDARAFKANWENMRLRAEAEFAVSGKNLALKKVTFGPYTYDSKTVASYSQVTADADFRPIDFSAINYDFGEIAGNTSSAPVTVGTRLPTVNKTEKTIVKTSERSGVDKNIPDGNRTQQNTFALIIANENYKRVARVPHALNDGEILKGYFHKTLGLPEKNIFLATDASVNDIRYNLDRISDICRTFNGEVSLIVYYSGHGVPDDATRKAYLLPVDGYAERLSATGIELNEVYDKLQSLPTRQTLVLLDACFGGSNKDDKMLATVKGVRLKPQQNQVKQDNFVAFSASRDDQTAQIYNEEKHGLFTYFILKKLGESKGNLTVGELIDYVTREVERHSVVEGKPQNPTVRVSAGNSNWKSWKF